MKRLNKKGFTLVELLAVIVVLAIIMVIATQVIGNVMADSRANSYASTVKAIRKGAETACTMEGNLTNSILRKYVEYSDVKVTITPDEPMQVEPTIKGKFYNMNVETLTDHFNETNDHVYIVKKDPETEKVNSAIVLINTSCTN